MEKVFQVRVVIQKFFKEEAIAVAVLSYPVHCRIILPFLYFYGSPGTTHSPINKTVRAKISQMRRTL
jgi:hypothetical protein